MLVTGATGFVGRALVAFLARQGLKVHAAVRRKDQVVEEAERCVVVGDIDGETAWDHALREVQGIVHLAARVHKGGDEEAFRRVNVEGTHRLAEEALRAGVRRFVFVSSLAAVGSCAGVQAVTEETPTNPLTPYGRSKLCAEQALRKMTAYGDMEIVVVRPPLVYGPGNPGNLMRLMRWVARGLPMPVAAVHNRRSFVGIRNLVDFLALCLRHPGAAGEIFHVADGEAISTPELVRRLAAALGVRPLLVPVPVPLLRAAGAILGAGTVVRRLTESCVVSIEKARARVGWVPPVSLDEGLQEVAVWYRDQNS